MLRFFASLGLGFLLLASGLQAHDIASKDAPSRGPAKSAKLDPWEPVDPVFKGCSEVGSCGMRGRNPRAVVQPGAEEGDYTYCPVSGASFRVKESSLHAEVGGRLVYFCCEACARHFAQNRDRVLALRGIAQ
jgi:YHS domain-containing protein